MKKLLLSLLMCFASFSYADVVRGPVTNGGWVLVRGSTNIETKIVDEATCLAHMDADVEARKSGGNYRCISTDSASPKYVKPVPPKPDDTSITITCASPLVGSWVQNTTYTLVNNIWVAQVSPTSAPIGACTMPTNMVYVDESKIPAPQTYPAGPRIGPQGGQLANPSDIGAFREGCFYSHMLKDDPMVYPDEPGKSHLHVFFGNVNINARTKDVADGSPSSCAGGTLNDSAYWVPAMIDTTNGAPIKPAALLVYYKQGYGGVQAKDIVSVPTGLRMISGNASLAVAGNPVKYTCIGGTAPNGIGGTGDIPPNCAARASLVAEVDFPQCWDGVNLDSPDHKSHMADTTGSGCPKDHPIALPKISYEVYYDLPANGDISKWRLSSDMYPATLPAGRSGHGDYMMGWDKATMQKIITNCLNRQYDCHANLLGDGTWLY